ncbi:MAG: hypothetical protein KKE72_11355 [Gammaproteobacteria bacterium]|nr:hypothetical protein [Gammaproteobacteria bacterium]MBU2072494.1 hypothetical protein [Gammaproteobacteria bacterium]MBU2205282.1 hypothetical protein [Gammaproteobacteria bacterium]
MSKNNFSPEQIEKNRRGREILEMRLREEEEKLKKNIAEAPLIGKEIFNLVELKKHWSYRYESSSTQEEIADAMQEIERDYYLAGDEFMNMEQYGKYLMRMELYR